MLRFSLLVLAAVGSIVLEASAVWADTLDIGATPIVGTFNSNSGALHLEHVVASTSTDGTQFTLTNFTSGDPLAEYLNSGSFVMDAMLTAVGTPADPLNDPQNYSLTSVTNFELTTPDHDITLTMVPLTTTIDNSTIDPLNSVLSVYPALLNNASSQFAFTNFVLNSLPTLSPLTLGMGFVASAPDGSGVIQLTGNMDAYFPTQAAAAAPLPATFGAGIVLLCVLGTFGLFRKRMGLNQAAIA